ncbi:MAG: mechanosensitive ion channel family protein, partial [Myxococcales bacterium]|nr:mechanosensitive ion channel family protein [Myxococcales bacterium]
ALAAWRDLAKDKTDNQDTYLAAIDEEIASVEERLRGLSATAEEEAPPSAALVCDQERGPDESPFEHYNACVRATKAELRAQRAKIADLAAAALMNTRSVGSLETLTAAQARDVELAKRELAIAAREDERATEADETERWRTVWRDHHEGAKAKADKLADALRSTKDTRRTLTVNDAFFASEKASAEARIERLEALLDESSSPGRFMGALAESAWIFLKKAWMVPVYILLAWLVLWLLRRVEKRVVHSATEDAETKDEVQRVETLAVVARGAVKLVVIIATGLLCLEAVGVDTGPILGGAAIFGLAISFGSQSLVKDFVTGFFILLENQYAVGDIIEANGNSGTVEAITMRRTVLRDLQGRVHHIPNGSIENVTNTTQGWARVLIHMGVAYECDLDHVEAVVNRVGDEMKADEAWADKIAEPPRYIGLVEFGDSALVVRIMFQTIIFEQWAAEREFNKRMKKAFDAEGIGIPFPQRDLHLIDATPLRIEAKTGDGARGDAPDAPRS